MTLSFATDGSSGLKAAREEAPSLIVLDLGLPVINGVEVHKLLKSDPATAHVPILVMTAMEDNFGAMASLVESLRPGDYVHKPFGAEEFVARVERLLATGPTRSRRPAAPPDLILRRGRIRFDLTRNQVHVRRQLVKLPQKLFALLRVLISHTEAVSVERLLAEGWAESADADAVKKAIQRLRETLHLTPDPIATIGHGYKLVG